jgi:hypothetical protein
MRPMCTWVFSVAVTLTGSSGVSIVLPAVRYVVSLGKRSQRTLPWCAKLTERHGDGVEDQVPRTNPARLCDEWETATKQLKQRHRAKRESSRLFWKPSVPCDRAALLSVPPALHRARARIPLRFLLLIGAARAVGPMYVGWRPSEHMTTGPRRQRAQRRLRRRRWCHRHRRRSWQRSATCKCT